MTPVREANDEDLRLLIHAHKYVIVKFIDDLCEICKTLAPKIDALAGSAKYKDVLFLRIDAKENPVSQKEVSVSGTPFFATYKSGKLLDCGLLEEEEGIKLMLNNLISSD